MIYTPAMRSLADRMPRDPYTDLRAVARLVRAVRAGRTLTPEQHAIVAAMPERHRDFVLTNAAALDADDRRRRLEARVSPAARRFYVSLAPAAVVAQTAGKGSSATRGRERRARRPKRAPVADAEDGEPPRAPRALVRSAGRAAP